MARAVRSGSRADTALLALCAVLALLATALPGPVREDIAAALRRTVVWPLLSLQQAAERARAAFLDRDEVAVRVDSLSLRVAQLRDLDSENARLRALLGLSRQLQWGFVPAEALHNAPRAESDVVVLTAGSSAGVRSGALVVASEGLVGKVTTVDPDMSLAILWTHPDFRASVMAADGSAFGIAQPHQGGEPERYLLEMRGVAFRDQLQNGTLITTSGLGGVYPRGIPLGTVVGELRTIEGWARTYLVRPAVRPQDVTHVLIVRPDRVAAGVATAWSSVASADSAVQRIVAAGDSMARADAEARAVRQRMLDSATALLRGVNVAPSVTAADSLRPRLTVPSLRRDSMVRRDTIRRP